VLAHLGGDVHHHRVGRGGPGLEIAGGRLHGVPDPLHVDDAAVAVAGDDLADQPGDHGAPFAPRGGSAGPRTAATAGARAWAQWVGAMARASVASGGSSRSTPRSAWTIRATASLSARPWAPTVRFTVSAL